MVNTRGDKQCCSCLTTQSRRPLETHPLHAQRAEGGSEWCLEHQSTRSTWKSVRRRIDAVERTQLQLKPTVWVKWTVWMIPEKRSQKSGPTAGEKSISQQQGRTRAEEQKSISQQQGISTCKRMSRAKLTAGRKEHSQQQAEAHVSARDHSRLSRRTGARRSTSIL